MTKILLIVGLFLIFMYSCNKEKINTAKGINKKINNSETPKNKTLNQIENKDFKKKWESLIFNKNSANNNYTNHIIENGVITLSLKENSPNNLELKETEKKLIKLYYNEVKKHFLSKKYKPAYKSLKKLLLFIPYSNHKLWSLKYKLERTMKTQNISYIKFEVVKKSKKLNWLSDDTKKKLDLAFPDKEINTAIQYYIIGNIVFSITYLKKIVSNNLEAKDILKKMMLIKKIYIQGETFFAKQEYNKAKNEWKTVLELEKQLLKNTNIKSRYSNRINDFLKKRINE